MAATIDYVLTLKPKWLVRILSGQKTWELQKTSLGTGAIALVASGTGHVWGRAMVSEISRMNACDINASNFGFHGCDAEAFQEYIRKPKGGEYAELQIHKLARVVRFNAPVPFKRTPGAIIKDSKISAEVRDQLAQAPGVPAITPIDQDALLQQMCKIRKPSKGIAEKEKQSSAPSAGSDGTEAELARPQKRRRIEHRK